MGYLHLSLDRVPIITFRGPMQALDNGEWMTIMNGRVYRWFPGEQTLKQRKNRDHFQLVIEDLPEGMTETFLIQDRSFCENFKIKSFKIITSPKKVRKLVAFFESYNDQERALRTSKFNLFGKEYKQISDQQFKKEREGF